MDFVFVSQKQATSRPPRVLAEVAKPSRAVDPDPIRSPIVAETARNRRWSERAPTSRDGMIGASGREPVACLVRNLSRFGALLETDGATVPDAFNLVFTHNRIRSEANCIVRWRYGNRIGVHFAGALRTTVDARKAT